MKAEQIEKWLREDALRRIRETKVFSHVSVGDTEQYCPPNIWPIRSDDGRLVGEIEYKSGAYEVHPMLGVVFDDGCQQQIELLIGTMCRCSA